LLDHLGELVIARDRLERQAARLADSELGEAVAAVTRLVGGLRDEVLGLRTVPVGEVFGRFPRLVRDAARALGREVALELVGEDEELDRSLTSELGDLLVHLVRNSVDHGIEPPEEREREGKDRVGHLRLAAERTRGGVVVRVEDDGRGLQRNRILERAVERGLVPAGRAEALTDDEVFRLITLPGFSTAAEVTEVSGRGVGLDAVRARVAALGGALEVSSEEGEGTTFSLRLPLSLSLVRVLLLEAAGETYAVPTSAVVEVGEFAEHEVERAEEGEWLDVRGERLSLLRLPSLLEVEARSAPPLPVLVLEGAERRFALAVDRLLRQRELVVKPFDGTLQMVKVFSGAALLADGRPCLMLDAARLAARAADAPAAGAAPAAALI
ncbi:MAG TPA: chemotaxis protein CheW, partial [Longimicrobiaceae bacterium]|nr:chemotaxis protein CheW [Longimicrobiaceae bacterium]